MPRLVSLYGMPRVLIDADWRFAEEDFWHHSGTRSHPELGHQLLAATTLEGYRFFYVNRLELCQSELDMEYGALRTRSA